MALAAFLVHPSGGLGSSPPPSGDALTHSHLEPAVLVQTILLSLNDGKDLKYPDGTYKGSIRNVSQVRKKNTHFQR